MLGEHLLQNCVPHSGFTGQVSWKEALLLVQGTQGGARNLRGLEDGQDREGFPVARERDDLQVCRPFHRTSNMTSL